MSALAAVVPTSESVVAILDQLSGRLSGARLKEARTFAEGVLGRVADDDLAGRSQGDWAALILDLLEFVRARATGKAKIRVFNPTLAEHGWDSPHTVIQIVNDDMPFLVDSVGMAIAAHGAVAHTLIHPVVLASRDPGGHLLALGSGVSESVIHVEIDRQPEVEQLRRLKETLERALVDVRLSVTDWAAMRQRIVELSSGLSGEPGPAGADEVAEIRAFLDWVGDDHFTFLGYREYEVASVDGDEVLRAIPGTGLGILRGDIVGATPRSISSLAANDAETEGANRVLIITKTNARATVHRVGNMDYIGLLRFDAQGKVVGERRFIGLFTSGAYMRRPQDVPLVRTKVAEVMQRSGLRPDSHSGKALKHILETLPRDELFQCSTDELYSIATGILGLHERSRTRLFLRRDRFGRFFSALAFIPRDRFNTGVRERIEAMLLQALQGQTIDTQVQVGDSTLARLHMVIRPPFGVRPQFDTVALEAEMARIVRNWHDELRDILVQRHGDDLGLRLATRYQRALPAAYVEQVPPEIAAADLLAISHLGNEDDLRLNLYHAPGDREGALRFKLYRMGQAITLSEALPMMENMGLRVLAEHPYEMEVAGSLISIQDFEIAFPEHVDVDLEVSHRFFEEAFEAVWRGRAESDSFNRLIIGARLFWREVAVLRAYAKYLQQVGTPFSQSYIEQTLNRYPVLARLLIEVFQAKFDPARVDEPAEETQRWQGVVERAMGRLSRTDTERAQIPALVEARGMGPAVFERAIVEAVKTLLEEVGSLDEDRILRSLMAAIHATLRTNFYQLAEDGRPHDYISFKFDPARLIEAPKPRPYREIFVYSPRIEGTHLRFGPVARGGLRWSDRREDFRTEVLGLVKAQMVKNTVIVPVGAKGGFIVKRPPASGDRDAMLAEGVSCYRSFINGLLDITDNLVDGKPVPPKNVVRHDGDDPYLVVAADKGTATFSDIANSVSAEHDFWLGDAFASGGSYGYDHKGMGITARGAWESVKRHFRALGVDCQKEDFTCVGIGDMSGDVFGNGMLLSEHIRLVAAFDHRHIFIDPQPDSARGFKERKRLFNVPRSSWDDYDRSLISEGGGIWPRSAKTIPLSPQAREALGIADDVTSLTPNELMKAILKAPVGLLWNGGIGTYVKASSESHADVGDRANTPLRVDGRELRCKVVGEGGNLGMTQLGRIEAARAGVLLNTDFIDNSAGVDTSDHEVNIKILLNELVQRGVLSLDERNALLVEMTDEVAQLVLNDNYRQNQAISLMERMGVARLGSKQHFVRTLEAQGKLDRAIEYLPSDAEFEERRARGEGLTRPELAVLLSYSKIELFERLLESDVPEDPHLSAELARYFPKPIQERYGRELEQHRLRREIIATAVTNSIVNRMGSTFVLRMQEDTGQTPAQIAKAYSIAREILDARALWADIDALDGKVTDAVQVDALMRIWQLLRSMTRWLLNLPGDKLVIANAVARYAPGLAELRSGLGKLVSASEREAISADASNWQERGVPKALAAQLAGLSHLAAALDIVEVAAERGLPVGKVAEVYFQVGDTLHLKWLMDRVEDLPVTGRWHAHARGSLRDELFAQHRALTAQILAGAAKPDGNGRKLVEAWFTGDDPGLRFTLGMLADMRNQLGMDYPTVMVAVHRLAQLVNAGRR
ncbi:NAD-glutamate dehydrogenase [Pseudofulvimonas gallinarii]|uniref:Glutamate dehydrogenase (NAD) n=2 Tax=Pseudofulvimonas gallinarii TaxID=634155 RepID=A0A4R3LSX6_9GAMM|nr:NAD-glutamate dehydrogenase domain-containing protein [Pseudofulvimonas gallinarii]TCT01367.1 glutamate dehydrogenase (NAD) [Pseudofulvimonas gallinarii]THD15119.1 glutamate dehydrogenase [Pseudofulvimonas gallinarii]